MQDTPIHALPLLAAGQAQKHVTHNEALLAIDALLQIVVGDKDLSAPPSSPAPGARYIVGPSPTGAWAGKAGAIATWRDESWTFIPPKAGTLAFVADEGLVYVRTGSAWSSLFSALASLQNLGLLGLGTAADETNRFAAKLNTALWTARPVGEGGTGDLRYVLNKEAAGNTLSFLFQTGYSGRLELGLVGSDDPAVKVSPDGSTWRTALSVSRTTGGVDFLSASTDLPSGATCDLGAAATRRVVVTGSAPISSFGTQPHRERLLRFEGALTLVHDPVGLKLPGGADIVTAAGDTAEATSDAAGNWTVRRYGRASGKSLVPPSPAEIGLGPTQPVTFGSATVNGDIRALGVVRGAYHVIATEQPSDVGFVGFSNGNGPGLAFYGSGSAGAGRLFVNVGGAARFTWETSGHLQPCSDNGQNLGSAGLRFATLYAGTGTINTSDARLKTPVAPLREAEIAAARDLAAAIGTFRYLESVAEKGDGARLHVGLTVQRALDIMRAHGLDPFRYGFICHDRWDEQAAIEGSDPVPPRLDGDGALAVDRDGRPVEPGRPGRPRVPGRAAGDLYSFRPDQLALFIARGQEARLAALEARLAA